MAPVRVVVDNHLHFCKTTDDEDDDDDDNLRKKFKKLMSEIEFSSSRGAT